MAKGRKKIPKAMRGGIKQFQKIVLKSKFRGKFLKLDSDSERYRNRPRGGAMPGSLSRGMPGNEDEDP